ncbi:hypothetical protein HMI01_11060 [Halolactibacillus miurensis]|uniref:Uncharacterized protein n=1 Tax=Halolactibacillus miurensis TaxID=306541 RepID=A0A1I6SGM4_9BACI|nr:hypothetical protein [Halolactibacillus miurensis]GEM04118.1 hypothetical protein HMI01_11060 [Halolactibacillus miurensis]SFS76116.1 hypothetical protein SAMN05421668_10937 [Halolactibacillus miurensis]
MNTIIEAIQKEVDEISKENVNYVDKDGVSIFKVSLMYEEPESKRYQQKIILTIDNGMSVSYKLFPYETEKHYLSSLSERMESLFNRTM